MQFLAKRGLIINNEAIHYFQYLNYYDLQVIEFLYKKILSPTILKLFFSHFI